MVKLLPLMAGVAIANQIPLQPPSHQIILDDASDGHKWWHSLPSVESVSSAVDSLLDTTASAAKHLHDKVLQDLEYLTEKPKPKPNHRTIYQTISENPHTTEFAKLIDEFPDLVDRLNDTKASQTIFVPIDSAFEHIPDDHKPDKEVLEKIINYHIVDEVYTARDVLKAYTIPTLHTESLLGGEHQRLRPGLDLRGPNINFYSRLVHADVKTTNGVIHAINHVLIPPPFVGVILSFLPSRFSTLLLAYEKTDFVKFIHGQKMIGTTMFAPSNKAFAALGVKANAFLFNTKEGHKYLTAILKYHLVPDVTVYSDFVLDKRDEKAQGHQDLPTLLDDATIGVDVATAWGLKFIRVNGFIDVAVHDGIAKNGVIHQVDRLPLPPHKKGKAVEEFDGEMSVDELKERLHDYI